MKRTLLAFALFLVPALANAQPRGGMGPFHSTFGGAIKTGLRQDGYKGIKNVTFKNTSMETVKFTAIAKKGGVLGRVTGTFAREALGGGVVTRAKFSPLAP
jgi:hypothetical protein